MLRFFVVLWACLCGYVVLVLALSSLDGMTVTDYIVWSSIGLAILVCSVLSALIFVLEYLDPTQEDEERQRRRGDERGQ